MAVDEEGPTMTSQMLRALHGIRFHHADTRWSDRRNAG